MRTVRTLFFVLAALAHAARAEEWPFTEGALGGGRYSRLAEIDATNVSRLEPVWTYRHGDVSSGSWRSGGRNATAMEATPIVVDGRLIFSTPWNRVIALDPETGRELWSFDPRVDKSRIYVNLMISRGVAYWRSGDASGECAQRVFLVTLSMQLWALDAATGRPCASFGSTGRVDLLEGLAPVTDPTEANMTSPPTVIGDVIVVGSAFADEVRRRAPPGDVRAFDARRGRRLWTFRTLPAAGEPGAETWSGNPREISGAANVWTTMTADAARDLVFLPVSSASPDFYGGDRVGDNLYSNALVALRASTGERVWHFQIQHHDIWDYDLPAAPVLVQVRRDGALVDAVAQVTKTGLVFVLDRDTGAPIFPIEESPVPKSDVPGEVSSPTQPFPTRPPPLLRLELRPEDLWDVDAKHHRRCSEWLARLRNEGVFTPPGLGGTLMHPYTGGGANWSGAAYDPIARRLFVPVGNDAGAVALSRVPGDARETGRRPYSNVFGALLWYVRGTGTGLRYRLAPPDRRAFAIDGRPCNRPPWGMLVAVGLDAGVIEWSVPTGEEGGIRGLFPFGPALVTAGGLVFHAGTRDLRLRVHDVRTGAVVHQIPLPAGLHAGPISYRIGDGPQWIAIAAGGHPALGSKLGDYVIAYRLGAGD